MKRIGWVAGMAATLVVAGTAASTAGAATPSKAALGRALDGIVDGRGGPPGVEVLIRRGGRTEYLARGVADVRSGRRPARRDHMRMASVAKAYSGAVALSLVDQGRLSLDDTIGKWLPGLLPKAEAVTLGQVLHHTGGLPEYIRDPAFVRLLQRNPHAYRTPRQLVAFVADDDLEFPPGTKFEYSDTDNIVAGLMAEAATGRSYDELLSELVYRRVGVAQTSLPKTARMPNPVLRGYEVAPGRKPEDVTTALNPALAWASGGIVSTPGDVGAFFRAYVGGRLFGPATTAQQRQWLPGESQPAGPGRNSAGLALFRYQTRCGTVYGHTGSFPGYRQLAVASADGSRSVVFTVNAQIVPGRDNDAMAARIRAAQLVAVCRALG